MENIWVFGVFKIDILLILVSWVLKSQILTKGLQFFRCRWSKHHFCSDFYLKISKLCFKTKKIDTKRRVKQTNKRKDGLESINHDPVYVKMFDTFFSFRLSSPLRFDSFSLFACDVFFPVGFFLVFFRYSLITNKSTTLDFCWFICVAILGCSDSR